MRCLQRWVGCLSLLMVFAVPCTYACEPANHAPYPSLRVDGGLMVIEAIPVIEDEGKAKPEMGLGISFLDCTTSVKTFVARLPYVADPGEVKDAFLGNVNGVDKEVFIIHSAPIRAFTGVSYGSDYFSVMAFKANSEGYILDKTLTGYFGSGADVVLRGDDDDTPIYTYPYKERSTVISQLASKNFLNWFEGKPLELEVRSKTSIYSSMAIASKTKMYLIKGDKVRQEAASAGWISIVYKSAKGKEIRGWVLCEDVNGC